MQSRPHYNQKLIARARELRSKSTLSEVLLWQKLKKKQVNGLQFYRQFPVGNYLIDFYCKELNLAVEIDGDVHRTKRAMDTFRQKELEYHGISFLRFRAKDVEGDSDAVVARIKQHLQNILP